MATGTIGIKKRLAVLGIGIIAERNTQKDECTKEKDFGYTSVTSHIHKLWF
jgi:hypothetical protein